MIAVYAFVAGTLTVATLIAIDEDFRKETDHTRQINVYGAAASAGLFVMVLGLLLAL